MAIGDRELGSQIIQPQAPRVGLEAFGAGVAEAVQGLGQQAQVLGLSQIQVNEYLRRKREAEDRVTKDTELARWQGEQDRALDTAAHGATPGARGFTNTAHEGLRKSADEFLAGVPADLQPEYRGRIERYIQDRTTSSLKFEMQSGDREFERQIGMLLEEGKSAVYKDPSQFDDTYSYVKDTINKTTLSPDRKLALEQAAFNELAGVEFQRRAERAVLGQTPINPTDGSDVVAPGLPGWGRGMLNAIATRESPDYSTIHGGQKFENFADHPRVRVPLPDGEYSSAAGRYQMIADTWDRAQQALHLPDFSAVSQDRAALYTAERDFRAATGQNLGAVLTSGNVPAIVAAKEVLTRTWTGLKNMPDSEWVARVTNGVASGGTGDAEVPNPWTDPRYAGLDFETKLQLEGAAIQQQQAMQIAAEQAAAAAETQTYDQLVSAVGDGTAGEREVELAIANGDIRSASHLTGLRGMVKEQRETRLAVEKTAANLRNAGYVFTEEDDADLSTFYEKSGLQDGLGERVPEAAAGAEQFISRTGRMPKEMARQLEQMSIGTPEQQIFALDTAARLWAAAPEVFSAAASEPLSERAAFWRVASQYNASPEQALEQYNQWRSPEGKPMRERYADDAKELLKTKTVNEIVDTIAGTSVFGKLLGLGAEVPADNATQALLFSDYSALFEQYFPLMQGDEAKTAEMVGQVMSRVWGVNTVDGSGKLMKYSPTSPGAGFPRVNGGYEWIDLQIRNSMGWSADTHYEMVSDGQTAAEFREGRPSYKLVVEDANGVLHVVMDETTKLPIRVRPTVDEGLRRSIGDQAHIVQLEQLLLHEEDPVKIDALLKRIGTMSDGQVNIADVNRRRDVLQRQIDKWESESGGR